MATAAAVAVVFSCVGVPTAACLENDSLPRMSLGLGFVSWGEAGVETLPADEPPEILTPGADTGFGVGESVEGLSIVSSELAASRRFESLTRLTGSLESIYFQRQRQTDRQEKDLKGLKLAVSKDRVRIVVVVVFVWVKTFWRNQIVVKSAETSTGIVRLQLLILLNSSRGLLPEKGGLPTNIS